MSTVRNGYEQIYTTMPVQGGGEIQSIATFPLEGVPSLSYLPLSSYSGYAYAPEVVSTRCCILSALRISLRASCTTVLKYSFKVWDLGRRLHRRVPLHRTHKHTVHQSYNVPR